MQKHSTETEGFSLEESISSEDEVSKDEITAEALDKNLEVDGSTHEEIPEILKWTFNFNKGKEHYSKKATQTLLNGVVRGIMTERISHLTPLNQAGTIDPREGSLAHLLSELEMVTPQDLTLPTIGVKRNWKSDPWKNPRFTARWQKGKKSGLLQGAVYSTVDVPKEIPEKEKSAYVSEVVEGYGGAKPKTKSEESEGAQAGLYYKETTMPDAFITHKDGVLAGVVEVKAYSPQEFALYVAKAKENQSLQVFIETEEYNKALGVDEEHYGGGLHLGFDIEGEQRMLDILRDATTQAAPLEGSVPVVLRVPSDVANENIKKFRELCLDLGYENVAVQKLPYTFEELQEMSKQAIRNMKEEFTGNRKLQFSKRELGVLGEYAGVDF